MPNIKDLIGQEEVVEQVHSTLEKLDGIKPCAKCEEDVDGGLWDPEKLIMSWKCSNEHETSYKVG